MHCRSGCIDSFLLFDMVRYVFVALLRYSCFAIPIFVFRFLFARAIVSFLGQEVGGLVSVSVLSSSWFLRCGSVDHSSGSSQRGGFLAVVFSGITL